MSDNLDNSQGDTVTQAQTGRETGGKRKCRYCNAVKKPNVEWPDPEYCSGKCRKLDGAGPLPVSAAAPIIEKATLADYKTHPRKYRHRLDPEKLNWGEPLTASQLKQAGFRDNREPIPGDWDYVEDIPLGEETKGEGNGIS